MFRYPLAAAALVALAAAAPASANDSFSAGSSAPCTVPAAASGEGVLPPSPDSELEDKIAQLTQTISDLQDRLASVEDALGEDPDDADSSGGDGGDDDLNLASAHGAHRAGHLHRTLRTRHAAPAPSLGKGAAGQARVPVGASSLTT